MYIYCKSGIGSCIAPNTGFARHPVKGMCALFWMPYRALGPGVWWLVLPRTREQLGWPDCFAAKQRMRESKQPGSICSIRGKGGGIEPIEQGCYLFIKWEKGQYRVISALQYLDLYATGWNTKYFTFWLFTIFSQLPKKLIKRQRKRYENTSEKNLVLDEKILRLANILFGVLITFYNHYIVLFSFWCNQISF